MEVIVRGRGVRYATLAPGDVFAAEQWPGRLFMKTAKPGDSVMLESGLLQRFDDTLLVEPVKGAFVIDYKEELAR